MEKYEVRLFNSKNVSGFAFLLMITVYVFISLIGQLLAFAIFGQGSAYLAICSTFSSVSMGIVLVYLSFKNKEKLVTSVNIAPCRIKYLFLAVTIAIGMLFGLGFINDAFVKLFSLIGINIEGVSIPLNTPLHFIVFSIVLALLPAFFEECFFRGFMFGKLSAVKTWCAIITISLCFALYHKSLAQFFYQMIYGIILCLLFKSANSVIPCVLAHFLNNFAVICFEYFKIQINFYNPIVIIIGLLFLCFSVLILLKDIKKDLKEKEQMLSIKWFYFPFGLFGCTICLLFLVSNLFGV
ncbi:MAG: CPBP family intramembrane metalloprotease [Clostridiales bacterium]|nr:CPBP family intramembrane metalloprotease [Clostridiales bacterium]